MSSSYSHSKSSVGGFKISSNRKPLPSIKSNHENDDDNNVFTGAISDKKTESGKITKQSTSNNDTFQTIKNGTTYSAKQDKDGVRKKHPPRQSSIVEDEEYIQNVKFSTEAEKMEKGKQRKQLFPLDDDVFDTNESKAYLERIKIDSQQGRTFHSKPDLDCVSVIKSTESSISEKNDHDEDGKDANSSQSAQMPKPHIFSAKKCEKTSILRRQVSVNTLFLFLLCMILIKYYSISFSLFL